ncbi:MAG TPA: TolC family protein [Bryobacteraceae bacterium]|jgi:cobalt-zinc-cadmium efflux system outer membrane protein
MQRHPWRLYLGLLFAAGSAAQNANPPRALTWQEIQERFRTNNPTLLAGKFTIDEARADEITAYLRPNPNITLGWDQLTPFTTNPYRPIWQSYVFGDFDYLHERQHKRELRLASARQATAITMSAQSDLERTLTFNLRDAFVRVLLAQAVVAVARENLAYYDKALSVNADRYRAGSIAKVDLQRLELQRVQFASDLEASKVDLRTAKIDLLTLLRDRTPVERFDVTGAFDFEEPVTTLAELRASALDSRPDLREARQSLDKARTDHQLAVANGSTDPTFGVAGSHQPPPLNTYIGFSVSFPLRIFDRNQGEKAHTLLDITRNERLSDAAEITALHDVDSAYATLEGTLELLRPYKTKYLKEADEIRSTVSFAFEHGAASLLDFLDAQKSYRDTQLSYVNLVGSYLSAANQLNFAVGREVIR